MTGNKQLNLHIPEAVARMMEERLIPRDIVEQAIHQAEASGAQFIDPASGRLLTSHRPKTVTYWVEYSREGEACQVHSAYSHRMGMRTGGGLTDKTKSAGHCAWTCNRCHLPLEVQTVRLQYMQSIFPIDLPVCSQCAAILITEELATGKMAEAEQALEDK